MKKFGTAFITLALGMFIASNASAYSFYTVKEEFTSSTALAPIGCGAYLTAQIRYGRPNEKGAVVALQQFLNAHEAESLLINDTYDMPTLAALMRFQKKYEADILKPYGLTQPTGNVALKTLRKINYVACDEDDGYKIIPITGGTKRQ